MTVQTPSAPAERLHHLTRTARSLWMSEPAVLAHERHEVMVRLTALELHVEHLDLATAGGTLAHNQDIELELGQCESELRALRSLWEADLPGAVEEAAA